MLQSPLRSPLNAVVKDVIAHPGNRLPFNKFISALLSKSGRVAAYYGESWDEILAYNAVQVAAGTPSNCVAFEDSAGTIPLLAPLGSGKGCGLLLDRSLGLVRGPELFVARPGAYFNSGEAGSTWSSLAGTKSMDFVTVTAGKTYAVTPIGGTADRLRIQYQTTSGYAYDVPQSSEAISWSTQRLIKVADDAIAMRIYFGGSSATATALSVRELPGNHRIQTSATARGEMSRRVNRLTGTETLATQSILAIATNSILSFSGAGSITLSGTATGTYAAGTHSITTTAGTLTLTVVGTVTKADCRYDADANIGKPYQWVIDPNNYDEEGFPAFLRRQTDDWSKAHINPNGATKVFALTAIQKMSDAAIGAVLELGTNPASGSGNFSVLAPATAGPTYRMGSKGSTALVSTISDSTFPAPVRSLVVGIGDIANDVCSLTVNGTTTTSAVDQGTGTYTEQDVFFGARAGTSLFTNDREYSPPMILFMQPGDPGLTSAEIARLTRQFNKSIKAF